MVFHSRATPAASQERWRTAQSSDGHGRTLMKDQLLRAERTSSSTPAMHDERMRSWRSDVLAAEAKKAKSDSEDARLIPKPPSRIGRLAWSHWKSLRKEFVITEMPSRGRPLCISSKWWPAQGEHLKVGISLGTLKEERRSMSASWAAMFLRRPNAIRRSEHLASSVDSRVEPELMGAPRRTA